MEVKELKIDVVDVKLVRTHNQVEIPTYACFGDAGMDIRSDEDIIITPGETVMIKSGLKVELPIGYAFEVSPRSGLTAKTKLRVILGTVDPGYRGEIKIVVDNISTNCEYKHFTNEVRKLIHFDKKTYARCDFNNSYVEARSISTAPHGFHGAYIINRGDRIAQLKLKISPHCNWLNTDKLSESDRGDGGFGHTGLN